MSTYLVILALSCVFFTRMVFMTIDLRLSELFFRLVFICKTAKYIYFLLGEESAGQGKAEGLRETHVAE
jgi:hypothetical protein